MSSSFVTDSAILRNEAGLHARPSVKLTQLAKRHGGSVEVATSAEGPWVDAKSPVKLMRFKAPQGSRLFVRTDGADATRTLRDVIALIERNFDEPHGQDTLVHDG